MQVSNNKLLLCGGTRKGEVLDINDAEVKFKCCTSEPLCVQDSRLDCRALSAGVWTFQAKNRGTAEIFRALIR